jgi:hypothetical protein
MTSYDFEAIYFITANWYNYNKWDKSGKQDSSSAAVATEAEGSLFSSNLNYKRKRQNCSYDVGRYRGSGIIAWQYISS